MASGRACFDLAQILADGGESTDPAESGRAGQQRQGVGCSERVQAERRAVQLGQFGDVAGSVRWLRGGRFGVRLASAIDVLSILLAKTGFRASDYRLPPSEKFENLMVFEYFRDGGYDDL